MADLAARDGPDMGSRMEPSFLAHLAPLSHDAPRRLEALAQFVAGGLTEIKALLKRLD